MSQEPVSAVHDGNICPTQKATAEFVVSSQPGSADAAQQALFLAKQSTGTHVLTFWHSVPTAQTMPLLQVMPTEHLPVAEL